MLAVTIVAVLTTIAVPAFRNFQCRTRTTEARTILRALYTSSLAYYNQHQNFPGYLSLVDVDYLEVQPPPNENLANGKYYYFYFGSPWPDICIVYAAGFEPNQGTLVLSHNMLNPNDDRNGRARDLTNVCP